MHLKFVADPSITETLSLQLIPVLWMNTDLLSAHCPPAYFQEGPHLLTITGRFWVSKSASKISYPFSSPHPEHALPTGVKGSRPHVERKWGIGEGAEGKNIYEMQ